MPEHDEVCPMADPTRQSLACVCTWVEAGRINERAQIRRSVETLGGYIRKPEECVPVGVVLMLLDGRAL